MADDPAILESPLAEYGVLLYSDALDHLSDFLGGSSADVAQRLTRRAVQNAYNRLMNETDWRFLYSHGRVNMVPPYSTGTIDFDLTGGGTCERQLTLAGGTWPTWAKYGRVRINNIIYDVEQRISGTVLQLAEPLAPAGDIAASTAYLIYRNTYPFASNFKRICEPSGEKVRRSSYISPEEFIWLERQRRQGGYPFRWTIMSSENRAGEYVIRVYGYPTIAPSESLDFLYQRTMRPLVHTGADAVDYTGTISASVNTAAVTGSSTLFTANMVGSYMRFSLSTATVPSGLGGLNPFSEQRKIRTVTSTTAIVLDAAVDNAYSATKFTVSDPLDIPQYMQQVFFRCLEWQYAILSRDANVDAYYQRYREELVKARESDCIVDIPRSLGQEGNAQYAPGWRGSLATEIT